MDSTSLLLQTHLSVLLQSTVCTKPGCKFILIQPHGTTQLSKYPGSNIRAQTWHNFKKKNWITDRIEISPLHPVQCSGQKKHTKKSSLHSYPYVHFDTCAHSLHHCTLQVISSSTNKIGLESKGRNSAKEQNRALHITYFKYLELESVLKAIQSRVQQMSK